MQFMLQLALVCLMAFAFAVANLGSSYRYSCNWNTGQYKCTYVRCTQSFDGKQKCTTSVTTSKGAGVMGTGTSYRYHCDWNSERYQCTHISCTHYIDGHKNCTTRVIGIPN
ncbi:uncharacterized protein [Drosophila takahashii]|uniref:uncharacterized protein n=1 Tax=Drosophila takahashii TaxID=29030 RepID=UPI003898E3CB